MSEGRVPSDTQTMTVSWLIRALTLGLLAIILPLAARGLYGAPGAAVNIRWQSSVDAVERQRLETEWQLIDGQEVSPSTWRYDLTAPSEGRLRAIVEHPAVADTHDIDRQRHTVAPAARRTARRHGLITVGGAVAVGHVDRLAMLLGAFAGFFVLRRLMARTGPPNAVAAPPTPRARRAGAIALVLAPGVCLIAYPSVVSQMVGEADYPSHIEFARQIAETGAMLPHFGYHIVVFAVQALTPADWVAAAGIVWKRFASGLTSRLVVSGLVCWALAATLEQSRTAHAHPESQACHSAGADAVRYGVVGGISRRCPAPVAVAAAGRMRPDAAGRGSSR